MKTICISVLLLFSLLGVTFPSETNTLPTKITIGTETYEEVSWGVVTLSTVTIHHKTGISRIPLANLPPELQQWFGYNPAKAAAHRAQELAAQEQLRIADVEAAKRVRKKQEADIQAQTKIEEDARELNNARNGKGIAVYVKDLKNFPENFEGKSVALICNISGFERYKSGDFQLKVNGLVRGQIGEVDVTDTDGSFLWDFLIVSRARMNIIGYCHENIDTKHTYRANIYAVVRKDESGFYASVFRIDFLNVLGNVDHSVIN